MLEMDNPYDPELRTQEGVEYHPDHAFYNGKYYMYFGVVPVFLAFLPYRVITGQPLNSYHATQLYTALFILGVFYCFYQLGKKWFKNLSLSVYLMLSAAFSVIILYRYFLGYRPDDLEHCPMGKRSLGQQ